MSPEQAEGRKLDARTDITSGSAYFGPALSRDRLTFALSEENGNIWIAENQAALIH